MSNDPRLQRGVLPLWLVTVLFFTACTQQQDISQQNDALRAERLTLEQEVAALQDKLALREGELRAIREQQEQSAEPVDGAEPPRLAGVVLGIYSGPIDLDGDAVYDALRVYVRPIDQDSRQITAAASARVRLITIPAEGEPETIVDESFDTDAFHAAYRDGVTGTHYTLAADLPPDVRQDPPTRATLVVTLTDAATGRRYQTQKEIALVRGTDMSE